MVFKPSHDVQQLGVLRSDATDAGRLASLADVIRWLQIDGEVPLLLAIDQVADAVAADRCGPVFQCDPARYASIAADDAKIVSGWWALDHDGPTCGRAGAAEAVRRWKAPRDVPLSGPDLTVGPATGLAIQLAAAIEVFGYMRMPRAAARSVELPSQVQAIRVDDAEQLFDAVVDQPVRQVAVHRAEWSDKDFQDLVKAYEAVCKKGGKRGAAGRLVKEWAKYMPNRPPIDRRKVAGRLAQAGKRGITASGKAVNSIFNLAGAPAATSALKRA